jgi:hypothetical protein
VFLAVLTNGKKSDKTNTVATTTPASIDPLDQVSYVVKMIYEKSVAESLFRANFYAAPVFL